MNIPTEMFVIYSDNVQINGGKSIHRWVGRQKMNLNVAVLLFLIINFFRFWINKTWSCCDTSTLLHSSSLNVNIYKTNWMFLSFWHLIKTLIYVFHHFLRFQWPNKKSISWENNWLVRKQTIWTFILCLSLFCGFPAVRLPSSRRRCFIISESETCLCTLREDDD